MNPHVEALHKMAARRHRFIIGLMSGTSLDGLDIAYCKVTGSGTDTGVELHAFRTIPYLPEDKKLIRKVFAQKRVDLAYLTLLHRYLASRHAAMVNRFLFDHNIVRSRVDLIASHGQTIMHVPHGEIAGHPYNATFQIGDGDQMAVSTGIITVSDFRQKHVATGGQGAPLALYGDYLLCSDASENRVLLNIGGISNFTYLPAGADPRKVVVTDTGPGNTLMDTYIQKHLDRPFDADAAVAQSGKVWQPLLDALMDHVFFKTSFPRTTGPELFNPDYLTDALQRSGSTLSHEDMLCTLNRFTAESIARAIKAVAVTDKLHVYVSGGGYYNPLLMHNLETLLPGSVVQGTEALGIPPDAKEAVLFAVLANEAVAASAAPDFGRKEMPAVAMGKISFPS